MFWLKQCLRRGMVSFTLFVAMASIYIAGPVTARASFLGWNMSSAASGWQSFVCSLPDFLLFNVPEYCTKNTDIQSGNTTAYIIPKTVPITKSKPNTSSPSVVPGVIPSVVPIATKTKPTSSNPFIGGSADYILSLVTDLRSQLESFKARQTLQTDSIFDSVGRSVSNISASNLSGLGSLATASSVNDSNWSGTDLSIGNGGTGTSTTPSYGQVLLGNASGAYDLVATSSLGITAGSGSGTVNSSTLNQLAYYAANGTTVSGIATSSLGLLTTNVTEGSNLYFTDARVNSYIHASTTIPKFYTANTFTGNQTFNGANIFGGAATFNSTLTFGSLTGLLQSVNGLVSASSTLSVAYGGTGSTTAVGARESLRIDEPTKGLQEFVSRAEARTGVLKIGGFGDSLIEGLVPVMKNDLNGRYGFAGYELGWANVPTAPATQVTGAWNYWVSGIYYSLPATGIVTFSDPVDNTSLFYADTFKIYYVTEPGAGTFKVQYSTDGTNWLDESFPNDNIDASGTLAGSAISISKTYAKYRLRAVGLTGTVKVIGLAGYASNNPNQVGGFVAIGPNAFAKGGASLTDLNTVPTSILNPITTSIAPNLLIYMAKETLAGYGTTIDNFKSRMETAYASTSWLYLGSTIDYSDYTVPIGDTKDQNKIIRSKAAEFNYAFLDLYDIWGTVAQATSSGLLRSSDNLHPTTAGYQYISSYMLDKTLIGNNSTHNYGSISNQLRTVNSQSNFYPSAGIIGYGSGTINFEIKAPASSTGQLLFGNVEATNPRASLNAYSSSDATWPGWAVLNAASGPVFGCTSYGFCKIGTMDAAQGSSALEVNAVNTATVPLWVNGYYNTASPHTADLQRWTSGGTSINSNIVAKVDVAGSFTISGKIVSSTTTTASVFPYASTTALTVSGTNGLTLGSLTGPLQSINGVVSASSTMSIFYGGTGISTAPSYGQVLLGNLSGGYTLTATSSLGITGGSSQWTTSGSDIYYNSGKIGIGTTSPVSDISFGGDIARQIAVERNTTTNGLNFIIQAGGGQNGGSNKNGGTLTLQSGTSTGSGYSMIDLKTMAPGGSGISDNAFSTRMSIGKYGAVQIGGSAAGFGFSGEHYGGLDVAYGGSPATLLLGADNNLSTRTNNTVKFARIGMSPYTTSQNPVGLLVGSSGSSYNTLAWGGGTSVFQGATQQDFYTVPTINTAGISRLTINSAGHIGVNQTSPTNILDIALPVGSTAKTAAFDGVKVSNTATSTTASINKAGIEVISTGTWSGTSANNIGLYVSSVTGGTNNYDAIFNGGGNVGVGTTSPWRKLSVTGTVGFDGLTNSDQGNYVCIDTNKQITYSTSACVGLSSQTYKHDISSITSGLSDLLSLRPVSFVYNTDVAPNDRTTHLGFIAEEVNTINPKLVAFDENGKVRSVKYDEFAPVIVKAIQELDAKVSLFNTGSTTSSTPVDTTTIASTTADILASSTPTFIVRVAIAVKEYIQSIGEWAVDKITATLAIFDRVETKQLKTDQLCLEDVCLTKTELQALLNNANVHASAPPIVVPTTTATPAASSTSTTTVIDQSANNAINSPIVEEVAPLEDIPPTDAIGLDNVLPSEVAPIETTSLETTAEPTAPVQQTAP